MITPNLILLVLTTTLLFVSRCDTTLLLPSIDSFLKHNLNESSIFRLSTRAVFFDNVHGQSLSIPHLPDCEVRLMTSANSFKHQIELSVSIRCAAKRRVELCSKGIVRLTSGIQSSKSLHFYELVFLEGVPIGCPSGRKMLALNEHIARDLLGARQMLLEDNSKFVLFRYQPHHMDSALIRSILSNGIFSEKAPVAVTSFYSKFGYQFDHDSRSLSKMLESLLYVYYIEVKELIEQLDFPYSPMAVEVKKYLKQYARDYGFKNVANLIRHLHKSPIEKHMETCEFLVKHLYLPKHAQNVFVVDSTFYYAVEDLSSILSMSKTF